MTLTLAGFLQTTTISAAVATPASLMIIRLSENGDNPFKSLVTIVKIAMARWLGIAITSSLANIVVLGEPVTAIAAYCAVVGGFFHWFFDEGFWRGAWWAFGSLGVLAVLFVVAQILLGRYGLSVW